MGRQRKLEENIKYGLWTHEDAFSLVNLLQVQLFHKFYESGKQLSNFSED